MTVCTAKNGAIENFSSIVLNGVSARVLTDSRSWGFSSVNSLDIRSLRDALESAIKLAKASSILKKQKMTPAKAGPVEANVEMTVKRPPRDFSVEEIAEIPLDAIKGAREVGRSIADAKATYISIEDDKCFVSSEGTRIHQNVTRTMLFVDVVAKSSALICPASENIGHAGGLELFENKLPDLTGKEVAEKAMRLLDTKAPPSGKFNVVIDPTLCATLLHEAIGHPLEADLAMSGGGFGSKTGEVVSSELVTIYDDGSMKNGLGYFPYDDEGVECKHTVLVEKGKLNSFMHDRTSASAAGVNPTGNAHAWDYSVEPLIRQTNIGIGAGDYSLSEMLEGVKEGLFLQGTFGGQADSSADFSFGFQNARWIKNGDLGAELRGANVAGNAIEVFKTIDAVGKDVILRPGACGKGQFAVQGRVVPAIRCDIMVGGTGGR